MDTKYGIIGALTAENLTPAAREWWEILPVTLPVGLEGLEEKERRTEMRDALGTKHIEAEEFRYYTENMIDGELMASSVVPYLEETSWDTPLYMIVGKAYWEKATVVQSTALPEGQGLSADAGVNSSKETPTSPEEKLEEPKGVEKRLYFKKIEKRWYFAYRVRQFRYTKSEKPLNVIDGGTDDQSEATPYMTSLKQENVVPKFVSFYDNDTVIEGLECLYSYPE
ncbi:hypothetical protein F5Y16DRAFT_274104 [Xylariaceae sp. FL0255]|nr:hypothetical protein F5Y16DRAFT_274104 [Xylariaceae sp. FL0255]